MTNFNSLSTDMLHGLKEISRLSGYGIDVVVAILIAIEEQARIKSDSGSEPSAFRE